LKGFALLMGVLVSAGLFAQPADMPLIYHRADSVAALYPQHPLKDLRSLAYKLTIPFSDSLAKFRAIYKWVCANIQNDYPSFIINKAKREKWYDQPSRFDAWNKEFSKGAIHKLLTQNHLHRVCLSGAGTGYTRWPEM
jgi:hypothetical protein